MCKWSTYWKGRTESVDDSSRSGCWIVDVDARSAGPNPGTTGKSAERRSGPVPDKEVGLSATVVKNMTTCSHAWEDLKRSERIRKTSEGSQTDKVRMESPRRETTDKGNRLYIRKGRSPPMVRGQGLAYMPGLASEFPCQCQRPEPTVPATSSHLQSTRRPIAPAPTHTFIMRHPVSELKSLRGRRTRTPTSTSVRLAAIMADIAGCAQHASWMALRARVDCVPSSEQQTGRRHTASSENRTTCIEDASLVGLGTSPGQHAIDSGIEEGVL